MATEKKKEKKVVLTPKGIAHWPFLTRPNTQFKKDGEYKVTLELKPGDDGVDEFVKKCDMMTAKLKAKNKPYTIDDTTGHYMFKFSSAYKPGIFDAHGVAIAGDINVGSGSEIVVAVTPEPYDGFGGGIKLYLKAVQIIEHVEFGGASATDYGFGVHDGGFSAKKDAGFPEDTDDDLPPPSDDIDW